MSEQETQMISERKKKKHNRNKKRQIADESNRLILILRTIRIISCHSTKIRFLKSVDQKAKCMQEEGRQLKMDDKTLFGSFVWPIKV